MNVEDGGRDLAAWVKWDGNAGGSSEPHGYLQYGYSFTVEASTNDSILIVSKSQSMHQKQFQQVLILTFAALRYVHCFFVL